MSVGRKLFLLRFRMDDFVDAQGKAWESVPITLFVADDNREPLVPYEVGIENYGGEQDQYKQFALLSLFSEDEVRQLASYLKEKQGIEAEIDEVELPINDIWPWLKDINPTQQGFMGVSEAICSHMGLRIAAYFDIRGSKTWKEMNA